MNDDSFNAAAERLTLAEKVVVLQANEHESLREIIEIWTINSIHMLDWEAKGPYVRTLVAAAVRLYDAGYLRMEQSWGGVMALGRGREILTDERSWWTRGGDQGYDENGEYFLSLTPRGRQLRPFAEFSAKELPLRPPLFS